jgi:DDE_Tnp_1-associated
MFKVGDQEAVSLVRFFDDLPDPRSSVNRLHRLGDVIVIAICAVIATADGPTAIAQWAQLNEAWLKKHLALPHGIPGKDTFRRVLSLLSPVLFQQCFGEWLDGLNVSGDDARSPGKRHVAIDGKTLRRSHDRKNSLGPLHVVSAWASDRGVTLGQVATDEKSNEITAIPQLLEILDVEDAVVTIDADARRRSPPRSCRPAATTCWRSRGITASSSTTFGWRSEVASRTSWRRARSVGSLRRNKGMGGWSHALTTR